MAWKSAADAAKLIRIALKNLGWNSRKISVKSDTFSGGSSIDVTIKDPSIPLSVVEKIANGEESIRRCEMTHEILSGCNRYVSVRYSTPAVMALASPHIKRVKAIIEEVKGTGTSLPVVDDIIVGNWNNNVTVNVTEGDESPIRNWDADSAAMNIGIILVERAYAAKIAEAPAA
jgi:hypothetical protein